MAIINYVHSVCSFEPVSRSSGGVELVCLTAPLCALFPGEQFCLNASLAAEALQPE